MGKLVKLSKKQQELLKERSNIGRTPKQQQKFDKMVEVSQLKRKKRKDETWRAYRRRIGEEEVIKECVQRPKGKYAYINPLEEILGAHEPSKAEVEAQARIEHFVRA